MCGSVLESRRGGIKDDHLIILLDNALHLVLELPLLLQHQLALHDIKLSVRSHGLDIVAVLASHLLASLQITGFRRRAECQRDFGRTKHPQAHSVVFAADGPHVRHFTTVEQLVAGLHLRPLEHLEVINWLLDFFTVDCAGAVVVVPGGFGLEPGGCRIKGHTLFTSD